MSRRDYLANVKRIVVKVGTSSVTDKGLISHKKIKKLSEDVADLISRSYQVVIVSSGAISAGIGALGIDRSRMTIPKRQALASVGQVLLMNEYGLCFGELGLTVGQILLTEDDVKNRRRFLNGRHTIEALISMNAVPIVNENDSVVVQEIKFGDNDTLSAHVVNLIDADLLIILSDVDGFYMDIERDDRPVALIDRITPELAARAGDSGSIGGTGGMITKLKAAEAVISFGERMIIANSSLPHILNRIMDGEELGTLFAGRGRHIGSKRQWIAMQSARAGLVLDEGAVRALCSEKKSLLAAGIVAVEGSFDMGDIAALRSQAGELIGKGIVNYKSSELAVIAGKKTGEIKRLLGGAAFYDEVINRDNLVLMQEET